MPTEMPESPPGEEPEEAIEPDPITEAVTAALADTRLAKKYRELIEKLQTARLTVAEAVIRDVLDEAGLQPEEGTDPRAELVDALMELGDLQDFAEGMSHLAVGVNPHEVMQAIDAAGQERSELQDLLYATAQLFVVLADPEVNRTLRTVLERNMAQNPPVVPAPPAPRQESCPASGPSCRDPRCPFCGGLGYVLVG